MSLILKHLPTKYFCYVEQLRHKGFVPDPFYAGSNGLKLNNNGSYSVILPVHKNGLNINPLWMFVVNNFTDIRYIIAHRFNTTYDVAHNFTSCINPYSHSEYRDNSIDGKVAAHLGLCISNYFGKDYKFDLNLLKEYFSEEKYFINILDNYFK